MGAVIPAAVLGWELSYWHLYWDGSCHTGSCTGMGAVILAPVLGWEVSYWQLYWDESCHTGSCTGMGIQYQDRVSHTRMGGPILAPILAWGPSMGMGCPVLEWGTPYWQLYWDEGSVLAQRYRMGTHARMGAQYRDGVPHWDVGSHTSTHSGTGV